MYERKRAEQSAKVQTYQERIRQYEADKRRELPLCKTQREYDDKIRELCERWGV